MNVETTAVTLDHRTKGDGLPTIGIVSPGAMGSALGRAWVAGGSRVVATVAERSARTGRLAHGLELLPSLGDVLAESSIVVSVCPPGVASEVLDGVIEASENRVILADLNAISPVLAAQMATRCGAAGLDFVDGSISGGPPSTSSPIETRLFLSGDRADVIAMLPSPGLDTRIVGARPGVASAIKMCTASVYKGTAALWLQALETAQHYGVVDLVLEDLAQTFPDRVNGVGRMLAVAVSKSERYVAEMESIAATQASAGVAGDLFAAMANAYRRLATTPLAALTPEDAATFSDLRDVLRRLT